MSQGGCLACDLSAGRRPLPGGLIHTTGGWRVEHCAGPLGVGTLIVKHVVRMSVMTEPFHRHRHPGCDETFVGVEGTVLLETETERVELAPGHVFTVPAGVAHVTRPLTPRTVNLTVEHAGMPTEDVPAPGC